MRQLRVDKGKSSVGVVVCLSMAVGREDPALLVGPIKVLVHTTIVVDLMIGHGDDECCGHEKACTEH